MLIEIVSQDFRPDRSPNPGKCLFLNFVFLLIIYFINVLADFQDISGLAISGLEILTKINGLAFRKLAFSGPDKNIAMPTSV
jgi:hypothetical protein